MKQNFREKTKLRYRLKYAGPSCHGKKSHVGDLWFVKWLQIVWLFPRPQKGRECLDVVSKVRSPEIKFCSCTQSCTDLEILSSANHTCKS